MWENSGMKISIITAVLNNRDSIEDCIQSVISQTYIDIEYIIVDGMSTDGTMEIVNRYKEQITKVISEKDKGHVFAMEKGLQLASGDVVGFLHSDDFYADNKIIETLMEQFNNDAKLQSIYGDIEYVRRRDVNKVIRYWRSGSYDITKIARGWMPPHPSFFVKKDIYDQYGTLNVDFKISVDYELILRFLYKFKVNSKYIPKLFVKMRDGGISNRNLKCLFVKTWEDYRACRMYGLGLCTVFMKNIRKLSQFFVRNN
jgi:glycosyltransferase involved in cell wall biosynthesis